MEAEKIYTVHSMLKLVYHRNKNQHKKTKWWKWLSVLKHTTWNLARSLDCIQSPSGAAESPDLHIQCLANHVLPRCYLAFSTVVADGQFSTLGAVLLGTLACLAKSTGIDKEMKFAAQTEARRATSHARIDGPEDVGEVLSRDNALSGLGEFLEKPCSKLEECPKSSSKKSKKITDFAVKQSKNKKRKKKKDAIDDLFDNLL
ncbi:hypothetical protein BDV38DRAFT_289140 [Aspergillus pseudotamarii]|uniref:RNase MRP protein 1 RNA binding domain-containing protein n=1 Tax=Aspergillus pseudotamarii TaxID=132259 RepID=A0A5N6S8G9_ASPPS|nr:uncharacterized protein BDV38DRAFT_289140 [Aspergillus pseudotamarii]KAE8130966.1 hypothetical protein BDV38DRAFT_289140 [Aspergillus pseudotamarii]